jgi:hypothetical protein
MSSRNRDAKTRFSRAVVPAGLFAAFMLMPVALSSGGCSESGENCSNGSGKCSLGTGGAVRLGGANGTGGSAPSGGATGSGGSTGAAGTNGSGGSAGTSGGGAAAAGNAGTAGQTNLGGTAGTARTGGATGAGGIAGASGAGGLAGAGQPAICGGLTGASCPPSAFCFYNSGAACGAADQTGACRMKPSSCPPAGTPVCGCDGRTYANLCLAMLGGTTVAKEGECPPPPGSVTCGGLLGVKCPTGEYCRFPLAASCGSGDQTGVCTPVPAVCDLVRSVVCGCDGKNYDNACLAAVALTSVASNGRCVVPDGQVCGGTVIADCGVGKHCRYSLGNCGAREMTGTCATLPQSCTTESAPVCGCNGQTYGNACFAYGDFTSVRSNGACP